jgi:hypothetical protein
MTNLLDASDRTANAGRHSDPDLRFIDTVLADLTVFARLNRLSGLEADLEAVHARFVAEVRHSHGVHQPRG